MRKGWKCIFRELDVTCSRVNTGRYLLEGEGVVGVEEAEAVPAGFQVGKPVLAVPVFVAAETRRLIQKGFDWHFWTRERLLNESLAS